MRQLRRFRDVRGRSARAAFNSNFSDVIIGRDGLVDRGAPCVHCVEHGPEHDCHQKVEDHGVEGGVTWERIRYMSKKELFNSTLSRWVLTYGGSLSIDRADPSPSSIKTAVDKWGVAP